MNNNGPAIMDFLLKIKLDFDPTVNRGCMCNIIQCSGLRYGRMEMERFQELFLFGNLLDKDKVSF